MNKFHFNFSELVSSSVAAKKGIDNTPKGFEYLALAALVKNVLEPTRAYWNAPIKITSGYRCEALNKAVGGVANSQHRLGEAADITTGTKENNMKLYSYMRLNVVYDQLILEKGGVWIHVSYTETRKNRSQSFCS